MTGTTNPDTPTIPEADTSFGTRWILFLLLPVVAYILMGWLGLVLALAYLAGMGFGFVPKFWAYALNRANLNNKLARETQKQILEEEALRKTKTLELKRARRAFQYVKSRANNLSPTDDPEAWKENLEQAERRVKGLEWTLTTITEEIEGLEARIAEYQEIAQLEVQHAWGIFLVLVIGAWSGIVGGWLLHHLAPQSFFTLDHPPSFWVSVIMLLAAAVVMYIFLGIPWERLMRLDPARHHTTWLALVLTPLGLALLVAWLLYMQDAWSNSF